MGNWRKCLPNHEQAFVEALNETLEKTNKPIVDAINNIAKNTGNKTTKEYNELKTKYEELEKNFINVDSLLKDTITLYTLSIIKYNQCGFTPLNSDNIIKIMDRDYEEVREHQNSPTPDVFYKSMFDRANEVYEKLRRR